MKPIIEYNWKHLVVLDTCRYDYFEQNYQDFLEGNLAKVTSVGTCTTEWRDNTFPETYEDIVYITANPNLSQDQEVYGYIAGDHFHCVYELWDTDWDKYRGTVLPEVVAKRTLEIAKKHPDKRLIIHFQQPHEPYLMPGISSYGYDCADINTERKLLGSKKHYFLNLKTRLLAYLLKYFRNKKLFISPSEWMLRQILRMPPRCAMDAVRRQYGKKILRKAYEENLRYALDQVRTLTNKLDGTIIVTSDHGELLGEKSCYGHPKASDNPILKEVPLFVVKKASTEQTIANEDSIKLKLKALGYFDE